MKNLLNQSSNIQHMYSSGFSPRTISVVLELPYETVLKHLHEWRPCDSTSMDEEDYYTEN